MSIFFTIGYILTVVLVAANFYLLGRSSERRRHWQKLDKFISSQMSKSIEEVKQLDVDHKEYVAHFGKLTPEKIPGALKGITELSQRSSFGKGRTQAVTDLLETLIKE